MENLIARSNQEKSLRKSILPIVEKDDFETMKSLLEELQKELYSLGASVYQQAGAENATSQTTEDGDGTGSSDSNDGDDVIDAEFTESK